MTPTQSLGSRARPSRRAAVRFDIYRPDRRAGAGSWQCAAWSARAFGADEFSLPPDQRFYAGGRPRCAAIATSRSGRNSRTATRPAARRSARARSSCASASWSNYGFVGFIDAGQVTANGAPFTCNWHVGAGIGFRYYTSIGPIRPGCRGAIERAARRRLFRAVHRDRAGVLNAAHGEVAGLDSRSSSSGFPWCCWCVVVVGANLAPGRNLLVKLVPSLTSGQVAIAGLGGRFPDALRVATVELRDTKGAYLTLHDVVLDWSPLRLGGARARHRPTDRGERQRGAATRTELEHQQQLRAAGQAGRASSPRGAA